MSQLHDTGERAFRRLLGNRLQSSRKRAGLSLQQVADRLGLKSRAAVGHWETGMNPPDVGTLWLLARFYGTTLAALVSDRMTNDDLLALMRRQLEESTQAATTPPQGSPAEKGAKRARRA